MTIVITGYLVVLYFFGGTTTVVLKSYEVIKNEEIVRRHLLEYRGEAPGHETRISFLSWGIQHPVDFINIAEGIEPSRRTQLCEILGFAATDSNQDPEFEAMFSGYDSECLRIIRIEITKNRSFR